jgi:hypothetical protein
MEHKTQNSMRRLSQPLAGCDGRRAWFVNF